MANNSVLIAIKADISNLKNQLKESEKFVKSTQDEIYKKESELVSIKNKLTQAQEKHTKSIEEYMSVQDAATGDEKKSATQIKKDLAEKNKEYNNSIVLLTQQRKLTEKQIVGQREILRYNSEFITGLNKEVAEKNKLVAIDEEYNNTLKKQYEDKIKNLNSVLTQYGKEEDALRAKGETARSQIDKEIAKEEQKQAKIISNLAEQKRLEDARNAETLRQQQEIFDNIDNEYERAATQRAEQIREENRLIEEQAREENRLREESATQLARIESERNAETLRQQQEIFDNIDNEYERAATQRAEQIREENRLRAAAADERTRIEEETLRQNNERATQLQREYELTYQNTAAQNRYNAAFSRLEDMRTTGAITQAQYNEALRTERDRLNESEVARTTSTNSIVRHLRQIETLIVAYYTLSQGFKSTIGVGIELNKVIESNTYGIAALISTNAAFIDSQGNAVTSSEKFVMAQNNSTEALAIIKKESLEVGATFKELTEIYQQMIGNTLSAGDAFGVSINEISDNTIKFSKRLASFAEGIGMPLDRVREEARSLTSGNASSDSLIASIVFGSPSAANNAVKEAKKHTNGLTDLFNKMFKDFDVLADTRTYTKGLAQLTGAWQIAMGDMVEKSQMFSDITDAYYSMADSINDGNDEIVDTFDAVYNSVKEIGDVLGNLVVPAAAAAGLYALSSAAIAIASMNPYILAAVAAVTGAAYVMELFEEAEEKSSDLAKTLELNEKQITDMEQKERTKRQENLEEAIKKQMETVKKMREDSDKFKTGLGFFGGESLEEHTQDISNTKKEQEKLDLMVKQLGILLESSEEYQKISDAMDKAKETAEVINKIAGSSVLVELAEKEIESATKLALLQSRRVKLQEEYNTHAAATEKQLKRITDAAEDGKDISEAEVLAYEKLLSDKKKGEEGLAANAKAISEEKRKNLEKEIALKSKMIKSEYELQKAEEKYFGNDFSKVEQLENELSLNEENIKNLVENGAKQEDINKALKEHYGILLEIKDTEDDISEEKRKNLEKEIALKNKLIKSEYELQKAEEKYFGSGSSKIDQLEDELSLSEENIKNLVESGAKQEDINKALKEHYGILLDIRDTEDDIAKKTLKADVKTIERDADANKDGILTQEEFEDTKTKLLALQELTKFKLLTPEAQDEFKAGLEDTIEDLQDSIEPFSMDAELNLEIDEIDKKLKGLELPNIDVGNLGEVEKSIYNISDAYMDTHKVNLEFNKEDIELQKEQINLQGKYAKEYLALNEKPLEQKELMLKFDEDNAAIEKKQGELNAERQNAEIAGYASLAGAMASAFEQGSAGAIAFTTLQATLGIASSWTAIAEAWALGFPQNIPAVAMVSSAVLPIIGQLSSMGGGGGGGGGGSSAPTISDAQFEQEMIKSEGTLVTDLLQRQVELLEMIGENGTADNIQRRALESQYNMDRDVFLSELKAAIPNRASYKWNYTDEQWESRVSQYERVNKNLGFDLYSLDQAGGVINTNTGLMQNPMEVMLELYKENLAYNLSNHDELDFYSPDAKKQAELLKANSLAKISELQEITNDYILGLGDLASNMAEARENMEDSYDEISGTNKFAKERLVNAFEEMGNIAGGTDTASIEKFLLGSIEDIQKFNNLFTESVKDIFSSQDPKDLEKQRAELEKINKEMGKTYITSAEEALNMADAIDLVTEALTISRENTEDFINSRKTEYQLTKELGEELGVLDLAKTDEELMDLFYNLQGGVDGLTDIESDFIDMNSDLVDSFKELREEADEFIKSIRDDIATEDMTDAESIQYYINEYTKDIADLVAGQYKTGETTETFDVYSDTLETYTKGYEEFIRDIYADITKDTGITWDTDSLNEGVIWWLNESGFGDNFDLLLEGIYNAQVENINNMTDVSEEIKEAYLTSLDISDVSTVGERQTDRTIERTVDILDTFYASVTDLDSAIAKYNDSVELFGDSETTTIGMELVELYNNIRTKENELAALAEDSTTTEIEDNSEAIEEQRKALQQELDLLLLYPDAMAQLSKSREFELEDIDETNKYIQEAIWAEQDRQEALEESTAALEDYIEGIANQKTALIEAYEAVQESISDTLYDMSGAKTQWQDVLYAMNNIEDDEDAAEAKSLIDTYYDEQMEILEKQVDLEEDTLSNRIEILETEKDILESLKDFANDLTTEQLEENLQTDALKNIYENSFSAFNTAFLAGDDTASDLSSDAMSDAQSYLGSLNETASSREYDYQLSVLANRFRGVEGTSDDATLDDLNEQLKILTDDSEENLEIQDLQELSIDDLTRKTVTALGILDSSIETEIGITNTELVNLQDVAIDYLGADSDIVNWLQAINQSSIDMDESLSTYISNIEQLVAMGGQSVADDITSSSSSSSSSSIGANSLAEANEIGVAFSHGTGKPLPKPPASTSVSSSGYINAQGESVDTNNFSSSVLSAFISNGVITPSFAVGSPNIPNDMIANIHQGEMILPQTFAEGVRNGSVTVGGNQDALLREMRGLREENRQMKNYMVQLVKYNKDIKDINNESLISLQERGESY